MAVTPPRRFLSAPRGPVKAPSGRLAGHVSDKERGHRGYANADFSYGDLALQRCPVGLLLQKNDKKRRIKVSAQSRQGGFAFCSIGSEGQAWACHGPKGPARPP